MREFVINFGFYNIGGIDIASWFAIVAVLFFILAAISGRLILRGNQSFTIKKHSIFAIGGLVFMFLHAFVFIIAKYF